MNTNAVPGTQTETHDVNSQNTAHLCRMNSHFPACLFYIISFTRNLQCETTYFCWFFNHAGHLWIQTKSTQIITSLLHINFSETCGKQISWLCLSVCLGCHLKFFSTKVEVFWSRSWTLKCLVLALLGLMKAVSLALKTSASLCWMFNM